MLFLLFHQLQILPYDNATTDILYCLDNTHTNKIK
jgi:hypothetical protein